MIHNFGSGFTPKYTDTDGTQHTVDEFKIVGGGLNKWIKGLARDSALGWDEASFGASPSRSTTAPFSMTNIDNIEFGNVAQFEATMPMMTIEDFRDLQTVLHQRYFYVTFFNVQTLEWITREMMVTNNERERLYMRIGYGVAGAQNYRVPTIYGVQSVKVKFVATNRNLSEYDEGLTVDYDFNGGTLVAALQSGEYDIGDQVQVYGRNDVTKGTETLQYWLTDKGGVIFPAQRFTIFEDLNLTAIWGEEDLEYVGISYALTNVYGISALPETMRKSATITIVFAAESGYTLPSSVTVSGSVGGAWNKYTGELTLSQPTSDITITAAGVEASTGDENPDTSSDELLGTWVFNDILTTLDIPSFKVGFTVNGFDITEFSRMGYSSEENYIGFISDSVGVIYRTYIDGEWFALDFRTIKITDVSQLTNRAAFENWLKANATKQASDELLQTWVFNESINAASFPPITKMDFASIGRGFEAMNISDADIPSLYYVEEDSMYSYYEVYKNNDWVKQEYRVITILTTPSTGYSDFSAWLKVSAAKLSATKVFGAMVVVSDAEVALNQTNNKQYATVNIGNGSVSGTTIIIN